MVVPVEGVVPRVGSQRRGGGTSRCSGGSCASAPNSWWLPRRYSLGSPGKWTFGSRSTSRHLFMSRGLPLRAMFPSFPMLRTLSLVGWEIRSVVSCTSAFCGATHSAVEHREEGVEAFRQQRVREDRIRHVGSQRAPLGSRSPFCRAAPRYIGLRAHGSWRQALAVRSVRSLSGQGPKPFPRGVG